MYVSYGPEGPSLCSCIFSTKRKTFTIHCPNLTQPTEGQSMIIQYDYSLIQ